MPDRTLSDGRYVMIAALVVWALAVVGAAVALGPVGALAAVAAVVFGLWLLVGIHAPAAIGTLVLLTLTLVVLLLFFHDSSVGPGCGFSCGAASSVSNAPG